jgi:hypothetical protein
MTAANSELPAEQPAQDTGDRSSLIAAICSAVAAAAYAAWFLYGERTRAMILPPIAGLVFAIVWSLRASAFYRRMVGILVGIGSTSAAVPTLVVAAKGPDHQLDAKITGTSVVFSVGCIAGAVVFGILNYMSSRKPRRDSRPD